VIPLLLMLAAADAPAKTPVDAERAFAADAKTIGQWTAFRKWSTDDAVMFVPQPTNAHDFLEDRKDPAQAIDWWPTASYISCDGKQAVNTGGWRRPDGSVGFFTTMDRRRRRWTHQVARSGRTQSGPRFLQEYSAGHPPLATLQSGRLARSHVILEVRGQAGRRAAVPGIPMERQHLRSRDRRYHCRPI
jgi:hypothetical protein